MPPIDTIYIYNITIYLAYDMYITMERLYLFTTLAVPRSGVRGRVNMVAETLEH